ncbi:MULTISPECIES: glycerate kinase [unclassified Acinetobacter]|uniref:glycerate kinase family protein n=1 Tax=unclassified Acinetobacter TaxID=196816 RepID=UPI0025B88EFA|nr:MULTISPECIES: glycerate kinase [unclassified Acinetobacter]
MPKTFVLAPDSFKESMTAEQACQAMQRGIEKVCTDAICISVPMADGGEGTVDALVSSLKGQKIACEVTGPLPVQKVKTYFGLVDEGKTAVIEMAKANGIHLIEFAQRNPLLTTTLGTGEMIKAALDLGVSKIIIGLGGSVTNDAGAGMAQAMGAKFLDAHNTEVAGGGGQLDQIQSIDLSGLESRLKHTEIIIASDVNNPLCGANGASHVFGPQKGATAEMVKILDNNLNHFADVVEQQLGINYREIAGAGAAGGLGFGLMAFAGAKIRSGVELVIEQTKLAEKIAQADYVFTGEGKIDFQTKFGKTPFGVAQVAKRLNKPVIAFAGLVGDGIDELYDLGFTQIVGINPPNFDLEDAMQNAEMHLEDVVVGVLSKLEK